MIVVNYCDRIVKSKKIEQKSTIYRDKCKDVAEVSQWRIWPLDIPQQHLLPQCVLIFFSCIYIVTVNLIEMFILPRCVFFVKLVGPSSWELSNAKCNFFNIE